MSQDFLRKKLKISKLTENDFNYQDIADMLQIKIGSLYNWLNGAYDLGYSKAKYLENWLNDRE